jgi:hypothetical protein
MTAASLALTNMKMTLDPLSPAETTALTVAIQQLLGDGVWHPLWKITRIAVRPTARPEVASWRYFATGRRERPLDEAVEIGTRLLVADVLVG